MNQVELRSDNNVGAAPEILRALAEVNEGSSASYGADATTAHLNELASDVFEHEVRVFPVATGTAANSLGLSAMAPPWGAVLCHEEAHILANEAGATSMYGGGLQMQGLAGIGSKVSTGVVGDFLERAGWGDPHNSQPAVLSVSNATEYGAVYTPGEVRALADVILPHKMRLHMDGARIANALAATGVTPAQMTWRAGVSVLSLGATKNGALSTDAIVSFDPEVSEQLLYRTKRAGHTASKMRFQSAQLVRYLEDGLWLNLAAHANAQMARLWEGLRALGVGAAVEPQANILFADLPVGWADILEREGVAFYRMGGAQVRLVTNFTTTDAEIDHVLRVLGGAPGG